MEAPPTVNLNHCIVAVVSIKSTFNLRFNRAVVPQRARSSDPSFIKTRAAFSGGSQTAPDLNVYPNAVGFDGLSNAAAR